MMDDEYIVEKVLQKRFINRKVNYDLNKLVQKIKKKKVRWTTNNVYPCSYILAAIFVEMGRIQPQI